MNSERMTMIIALAIAACAFFAQYAVADPTAPTELGVQSSETRDLSGLASQSVGAQGGNVTQVNINALTITTSWQGYYGDISGEITLDDAGQNTFYNWSATSVSGEVYATRNDTVTWSEVFCANSTHIGQEETYLGQSSTDGDSVTNTYGPADHPDFSIGGRSLGSSQCNTTHAFTNSASQSGDWIQLLLHQNDTNTNNIVYATIINDTVTGFDGGTYDFQLLVGENEKAGSQGATTYYFWVELN